MTAAMAQMHVHDISPRLERVLLAFAQVLGWSPGREELPGASPPTDARPPVRPPTRRKRGPPMTGAERTAKWRREGGGQKKREQGCHPAPQIVDSPEQTHNDSHPYTAGAATSTALEVVEPVCAVPDVTCDVSCDESDVTRDAGDVTERHAQGVFKDFSTTTAKNNLPPKAPPSPVTTSVTSPPSHVTPPRMAPRALAAHEARQPRGRAGKGSLGHVTGDVTRDESGSRGGESALTPDGQVVPGHSFRDAFETAWRELKGHPYAWRVKRDDPASREVLALAEGNQGEAIRRLRNAFTYDDFPRPTGLPSLAKWWDTYAEPSPKAKKSASSPPGAHVGGGDKTRNPCPVGGCCEESEGTTWAELPLCSTHTDDLLRAMGNSPSNAAAASWLAKRNGGRQ